MKDQQPSPLHYQASDPDPTTHGSSPEDPLTPSEEEPSPAAPNALRHLSSRLTTIWQFAVHHLPSGRTRAVGAILVVGVLAVVIGVRSSTPSVPPQTAPDTKQFSVTNRPTLIFEHFIGNVSIKPGPSGQVSIQEKENGETDAIQIHYAQRAYTITVTVDIAGGLMEDTWVDFDVNVPGSAGFTTTMSTGTLEATNLSGRIELSNTNGAIWATNLTGFIGLKTQSGSINLTNVSGQAVVFTENGTITTSAAHLQGQSSIEAENGTINFHGTLSRAGSYVFQNGNGAVGLTLPSSSAFVLLARTAGGSINSDFRGIAISHEGGTSQGRGTVGSAAHAHLTIHTAGGSIDLHLGR